jgi:hypothetical protein
LSNNLFALKMHRFPCCQKSSFFFGFKWVNLLPKGF